MLQDINFLLSLEKAIFIFLGGNLILQNISLSMNYMGNGFFYFSGENQNVLIKSVLIRDNIADYYIFLSFDSLVSSSIRFEDSLNFINDKSGN